MVISDAYAAVAAPVRLEEPKWLIAFVPHDEAQGDGELVEIVEEMIRREGRGQFHDGFSADLAAAGDDTRAESHREEQESAAPGTNHKNARDDEDGHPADVIAHAIRTPFVRFVQLHHV
jgi:hypothetical protein